MPTNTADDLSLINDAEFLEEIGQSQQTGATGSEPARFARLQTDDLDSFAALDRGLDVDPAAVPAAMRGEPGFDQHPDEAAYAFQPPAIESRIPFFAAACILIACLAVGAVTAAVVFRHRLDQITAMLPASR